MNARILFCLALLSSATLAQQSPFRSPLFDAGNQTYNAAAGDVDGDGDADLVTNNFSNVRLLLQTAPGVFGVPMDQAFVNFGGRMQLADFDHDGDADVAEQVDTGNPSAADFVAVMLSNGNSLGAPTLRVTAQDPTDIAIADFDGDGDPDLALPCEAESLGSSGTRISLFFGLGNGSFTNKLDVPAGFGPRGIDVGDIDLDGHVDIAVINDDGTLRAMLGNGAGAFAVLPGVELGNFAEDVALGDVDADGDADAVACFDKNAWRAALGDGAGGWTPLAAVTVPATTQRCDLADVDEDGDADVITLQTSSIAGSSPAGLLVALSDGAGGFAPPLLRGSASQPQDLVVADLTADGDLDLFAVMPLFMPAGTGVLIRGDGRGGFDGSLRTGNGPGDAVLADLDLDGRPELIAACYLGPHLAVHPGLGHGSFGPAQLHDVLNFPLGLAAADIVEDGLPDVLVINASTPGGLTVRAGDGALGFGAPIHTVTALVPWGLGTGDADLDGHLDVVIACGSGPGSVQVLLGDGAGGFVVSDTVLAASASPAAAAFGDLNADGLPDVVSTTNGGNILNIALAEGRGQFGVPTPVPVPHYNQHDIAIGDLDGDDDPDLLTNGGFTGGPNVVLNDGSGNFSAGPTLTAQDTMGVGIDDTDGDGFADIVAVAETAPGQALLGSVLTWRGFGNGHFEPPVFGFAPKKSGELLLADLDGDGMRDVAAMAVESDEIWFLPNVNGPWQPLGKGLAGEQGIPRQQGFGTLQPGEPFEFLLTDSRPLGSAWHVIGLSAINAPFKGGTLVPTPLPLTGPWPLDSHGELSLQGRWPGAAAPGVGLWFQFLTSDPAAPKGFSLSTALKATLP